MPRPTSAGGRPGTEVIPATWEDAHAPVVAGTLTRACRVTNPAGAPVAADDLTYQAAPAVTVYEGPCRVQAWQDTDVTPRLGDQSLSRVPYLVVLARDAEGVRVGATVEVFHPDDPERVLLTLTVENPVEGSLRWERDLFCVLDRGV